MNLIAVGPLLTHFSDHWGHPWWPLWMLLWAALIGAGVWLILRRRDRQDPLDPARRLLAERFARGDLSADEYRARLDELTGRTKGAPADG